VVPDLLLDGPQLGADLLDHLLGRRGACGRRRRGRGQGAGQQRGQGEHDGSARQWSHLHTSFRGRRYRAGDWWVADQGPGRTIEPPQNNPRQPGSVANFRVELL
jgi:hypothetical protein